MLRTWPAPAYQIPRRALCREARETWGTGIRLYSSLPGSARRGDSSLPTISNSGKEADVASYNWIVGTLGFFYDKTLKHAFLLQDIPSATSSDP